MIFRPRFVPSLIILSFVVLSYYNAKAAPAPIPVPAPQLFADWTLYPTAVTDSFGRPCKADEILTGWKQCLFVFTSDEIVFSKGK